MLRKWFSRLDRRYALPCLYAAATALIVFCTGIALWNASGFATTLWEYACFIMEPMVYGAILSYLLQPAVRFFSSLLTRNKKLAEHTKRATDLAIILTIAALAVILALIVVFALIVAAHSLGGVNLEALQNLLDTAQFNLQDFLGTIQNRLVSLGLLSKEALEDASQPMVIINDLSKVFTLIMLSGAFGIYFLFDGERAADYLQSLLRALAGDKHSARMTGILSDADRVFSGFVRGQFIDAIAVGALMMLALTIVGIPYAPFIGVISGIANIIPYAGGPVGFVLVTLVCYTEQTMSRFIFGLIAVAVVMFIDGNFIGQKLLARTLTFHPMLVLVALVVGSTVGGLAGMLVAVPLFAFLKQRLDLWLEERIGRLDAAQEESDDEGADGMVDEALADSEADVEANA